MCRKWYDLSMSNNGPRRLVTDRRSIYVRPRYQLAWMRLQRKAERLNLSMNEAVCEAVEAWTADDKE